MIWADDVKIYNNNNEKNREKQSQKKTYFVDNQTTVQSLESHKDLRVALTSELSWSLHIGNVVKNANFVVGNLSLRHPQHQLLNYSTHSSVLIWNLQTVCDIPLGFHRPSYDTMLHLMKLQPLEERRIIENVILTYKSSTTPNPAIRHNFVLATDSRTRGQWLKLEKGNFQTEGREVILPNSNQRSRQLSNV